MLRSNFVVVNLTLCILIAEFFLLLQIAAVAAKAADILPLSTPIDPPDSLKSPQCCAPVFLAPISTSENNAYVTWSSNKTGENFEVMFRASADQGKTFGPKINLSNTPRADSLDPSIAALGSNVYVSWWERNQTSNEPVMRVSNDSGETFGPTLKLAANDSTIGTKG